VHRHVCGSLYRTSSQACGFLSAALLSASLGQTFRVHSPSHLELCASSSLSNGFSSRGIGLRPLASGSFMPPSSLCYFEWTLRTALAKYISCYTAPPQHLQRWFTCKKTLKNHTGLVTRSSAVVAERATHSCCLAYYLAGCDCRSYHHNSVGVPIDQQLVSDMPTMLYRVLNSSTVPEAAGRSETLRARNALLYDTVQLAQLFLLLYLRTYHQ